MWKTFWFILNITLVFCVTAASAQQIYKWKDENGQWHFSQTPPSEAIAGSSREPTYRPIDRERPSDLQHTGAGGTNQLAIIHPALKLKGDELHVTGTIKNTSEEIRLAVEVRARTFGKKGNFTASAWGDVSPKSLLPGRMGSFEFVVPLSGVYRVTLVPRSNGAIMGQEAFLNVDRATRKILDRIVTLAANKSSVIILRSGLEKGRGAEVYYVGKVYNSGNRVAKNVKVFFTVSNLRGVKVIKGTVSIKEVSPGGESSFRKRVMALWDVKGLSVTSQLK